MESFIQTAFVSNPTLFYYLLLIPVISSIIAMGRNVVGVKSYGFQTPMLIVFAFLNGSGGIEGSLFLIFVYFLTLSSLSFKLSLFAI